MVLMKSCKVFPAQDGDWWYCNDDEMSHLNNISSALPLAMLTLKVQLAILIFSCLRNLAQGEWSISQASLSEQKITHRGKSVRYKVDRDFLAEGGVHLRDLGFKANMNNDGEDLDEADNRERMILPGLKWSECYLGKDSRSRDPFAKLEGYLEPPIEVPWT